MDMVVVATEARRVPISLSVGRRGKGQIFPRSLLLAVDTGSGYCRLRSLQVQI